MLNCETVKHCCFSNFGGGNDPFGIVLNDIWLANITVEYGQIHCGTPLIPGFLGSRKATKD